MSDRQQDQIRQTSVQNMVQGGVVALFGFLFAAGLGVGFWLIDGDTTGLYLGGLLMVLGLVWAIAGKLYPVVVSRV